MLEGSMGDINVLQGKDADGKLIKTQLTIETEKTAKGFRYKKGGEAVTFPPRRQVRRQRALERPRSQLEG